MTQQIVFYFHVSKSTNSLSTQKAALKALVQRGVVGEPTSILTDISAKKSFFGKNLKNRDSLESLQENDFLVINSLSVLGASPLVALKLISQLNTNKVKILISELGFNGTEMDNTRMELLIDQYTSLLERCPAKKKKVNSLNPSFVDTVRELSESGVSLHEISELLNASANDISQALVGVGSPKKKGK